MKRACYNENDPKTAAWLREIIKAGLMPQVAAAFIQAGLKSIGER